MRLILCFFLFLVTVAAAGTEMIIKRGIPYAEPANDRQMLDVYSPSEGRGRPVVVWIHGGGWQTGDKGNMAAKPKAFVDKEFVFVAINYRLLPAVKMEDIVADVAKAIRWVHDHADAHGGDPKRLFIMGHSAGAQLAALICTDERHLQAEGLSLMILKGCVPVDGDTYDIPLQIKTASDRRRSLGQPEPKFGHREKFGLTEEKHRHFSAVTHIAPGKDIPPFLVLHVADHPDTTAQARRLHGALTEAGVRSQAYGAEGTNHTGINNRLGLADDATTAVLFRFLNAALAH